MSDDEQARNTANKNNARKAARIVKTVHPSFASLLRRKRLERDLAKWLKYYFPSVFIDPFGKVHIKAISKLEKCIATGGRFAFAMPRGGGKSAIGKGATLYCALTGKRKYIIPIGASVPLAEAYHDFCKIHLMENPRIIEDYPEICQMFIATEGKGIRALFQLLENGKKSHIKIKPSLLMFPNVTRPNGKPYPGACSIIETVSIDSKGRGKAPTLPDLTIARPDFLLPDDIQDEEIAASDTQSAKYEKKFISAFLGMAGPKTKIACYMPCTVQRKGDVMSRFLDHKLHPDFQGENVPMFIKWPESLKSLWMDYEKIWRDDQSEEKGMDRCNQFLRDNWDAMHKGAIMSWDERIRDGELSAVQTGMHLLFEVGDSFYSEYQGEPLDAANQQYRLDEFMIMDHAIDLTKLHLPKGCDVFVGHCDINRAGLHWCLAGFAQDMTCHVPLYGKNPSRGELWRENANQKEKDTAIFRGLKMVCDTIEKTIFISDGKPVKPSLLLVDRGYENSIVSRFCDQAKYSFRVLPNFGQPSDKYRPSRAKAIGRVMENAYYGTFPMGRAVAHNSDFWRETAQRSFLTDCGNAGGTTLFRAVTQKAHETFAQHVSGEKLYDKYDDKKGMHYVWKKDRANVNVDWLDAFVGCWAAAAYSGLSPSGMSIKRSTKPKRRKVQHINV